MAVLMRESSILLWQDVVRQAVKQCETTIHPTLESYLTDLLMRSTTSTELTSRRMALAFLAAQQEGYQAREFSLRQVGDECLLLAGLFPQVTKKRLVNLRYFVDLGKAAYVGISQATNDIFWLLSLQFVNLMDVLQCVRPSSELLPLEAYEQWQELGSERSLRVLRTYTKATPIAGR